MDKNKKILIIVLLGLPGSGKGTQAEILAKEYGLKVESFGDFARNLMKEKSERGELARKLVANGKLLTDEIINGHAKEVLEEKTSLILDGYPRTIAQAEFSNIILTNDKINYIALFIKVSDADVFSRLSLRGRHDDSREIIQERLKNYQNQTFPIVEYYRDKKTLIEINGSQSIEQVASEIKEALEAGDWI